MGYYANHNLAYDLTLFETADTYRDTRGVQGPQNRHKGPASAEKLNTASDAARTADREETSGRSRNHIRVRRRKTNFGRIALGIVAALAVVVIVASIIHGQVQLTELNQEIIDARADLAEKQSLYTQLEMKVDSVISTSAVEQYARDNLNMTKASNSQKEFIALSEGDKAEVTLSPNKSVFELIADAIASLWS